MGIVYFLLLPKPTIFHSRSNSAYMPISTREEEQEDNIENRSFQSEHQPNYSRISQHEEEQIMNNDNLDDTATRLLPSAPGISTLDTLIVPISKSTLSTKQKLEIAKPLFWNFMLPLFVVYFAEVSLNNGVKQQSYSQSSPNLCPSLSILSIRAFHLLYFILFLIRTNTRYWALSSRN